MTQADYTGKIGAYTLILNMKLQLGVGNFGEINGNILASKWLCSKADTLNILRWKNQHQDPKIDEITVLKTLMVIIADDGLVMYVTDHSSPQSAFMKPII